MTKIFALLCLMGCTLSLPIEEQQHPLQQEVHIIKNERVDNKDGSYSFVYETSDGQKREESAHVVELIDQQPILVVTGSSSYIGPDGVTYKVYYVADENGYRPYGDHIPTTTTETSVTLEPISGEIDLPPPVALPPNAINSLLG